MKELAYVVSIDEETIVGIFRTMAVAEAFMAIAVAGEIEASIRITTLDWVEVGK